MTTRIQQAGAPPAPPAPGGARSARGRERDESAGRADGGQGERAAPTGVVLALSPGAVRGRAGHDASGERDPAAGGATAGATGREALDGQAALALAGALRAGVAGDPAALGRAHGALALDRLAALLRG
jgi:hypothetical protein